MLEFNTDLQTIINTQVTKNTAKQFTDFISKKQLIDSKLLTETQKDYIVKLKNTFTYSLHNSKKFMLFTVWNSNSKTYTYYVLDMLTLKAAETKSVKIGKQQILELLNNSKTEAKEEAKEEAKIVVVKKSK